MKPSKLSISLLHLVLRASVRGALLALVSLAVAGPLPGAAHPAALAGDFPPSLSEGLLVYFPFDTPVGDVVGDESGSGNHGVPVGTPAYTDQGRFGGAFQFDVHDYIALASNPTAGLNTFAVSLWFKTDQPANNYKLASAASWNWGPGSGWIVGTHYPEAWSADGNSIFNGDSCPRSVTFVPGVWNHVVISYDGVRFKEYINGQLARDCATTGLPLGEGRNLEVAAWSQYNGYDYEGLLDEFRVYKRGLTAAEVAQLYAPGGGPSADAGGPYRVDEGGSVLVTASAGDPEGDGLTFAWDLDDDGSFETPGQSATFSAAGRDGPSSHTITVQVTDSGGLSASDQATVEVLNVAPQVGAVAAPAGPIKVGTPVNARADFTDPGALDTHTALWEWGDGGSSPGAVDETNGSGWVTGSHTYSRPGLYTLTLTVTDKDGGVGQSSCRFVVVYDPQGGFVTGGGWINSPPGACSLGKCRSDTSGKASFGFVAKYKKGTRVPGGVTGFQFRAGKLNFHSSRYDWLVVNGARAIYKGTGKLNGSGRYGFLVSVIDAGISPDDGFERDRFRMRIWDTRGTQDEGDDVVVYDNQVCGDTAWDAEPCAEIKQGSVVIHKK